MKTIFIWADFLALALYFVILLGFGIWVSIKVIDYSIDLDDVFLYIFIVYLKSPH